jgi:hypothetical protein
MMVDMIFSSWFWKGLGPSVVLQHLDGPPVFQAVRAILSVTVFDEKLQLGRVFPLVRECWRGTLRAGQFEMMDLRV